MQRDFVCFFFRFFFFERTRPAASVRPGLASFTSLLVMREGPRPFFAFSQNAFSYRGAYRVPLFIPGCVQGAITYLVCLRVCETFVVFIDCESCMSPISTNPGFMEAGEYGLTCGTCFVARRLWVVAVAGLLWISWCVLGGAIFFVFLFFTFFVFFERTRPAESMRPSCLIHLSTSTGVRTRCHYLISLSMYV